MATFLDDLNAGLDGLAGTVLHAQQLQAALKQPSTSKAQATAATLPYAQQPARHTNWVLWLAVAGGAAVLFFAAKGGK